MNNTQKSQQIIAVQSNYLIESHFKQSYTAQELKTILLAVSKIDNFNPASGYAELCITAQEFANFIEIPVYNVYRDAKKIAENLMRKVISLNLTGGGWLVTSWFSSVKYENGIIYAIIDAKLLPYLINLKEKFTIISLSYVAQMTSSYAIKLYQLLIQYKNIGRRTINVDELRSILGIKEQKSLQIYNRFKEKILEISEREINSKTDIRINYKEIKRSRKVVALEFTIIEVLKDNTLSTEQSQHMDMLPQQEYQSIDPEDIAALYDNLTKIGFNPKELEGLVKKYPIEKIYEKYQYFVFNQKIIRKPKAWLIVALKSDFNTSDMNLVLKKIEEDKKRRITIENEALRQKQKEEYFEQEFAKWENSKTDAELEELEKKVKQSTPCFASKYKAERGSRFFKICFEKYFFKSS